MLKFYNLLGATIILEDPYCWSLKREFAAKFCSHCLKNIEYLSFTCCPHCSEVNELKSYYLTMIVGWRLISKYILELLGRILQ